MKSFSITLAVTFFILIGLTWIWIITEPMKFFDREYPMWKAKADILERCQLGALVVVGDSRAVASIIPDLVGPGVVNLAIGGGSFIEAYAVSKSMFACKNLPKAVILSMKFTALNDDSFYWDRTLKFGVLNITLQDQLWLLDEARRLGDDRLYGKATPFDLEAKLKNLLYIVKFPSYYFSALVNSHLYQREAKNWEVYNETLQQKGHHYFGIANGSWEKDSYADWDYFRPTEFEAMLFTKFLDLYQEHNIPVYFISPPYNAVDLSRIKPQLKSDIKVYLHSFEIKYPLFRVIGDTFPSLPPEDFGDHDHTNPMGATIWSQHFADMLVKAGIEH